ncbi:MAG TPA: hypothetical protein VGS07_32160 [Thermoanaerobaculia bacterium]|nr:hypothetical protein [Thermoanaerobaculia bacterium]
MPSARPLSLSVPPFPSPPNPLAAIVRRFVGPARRFVGPARRLAEHSRRFADPATHLAGPARRPA